MADLQLTPAQAEALQAIRRHSQVLLHGVTGSGKTEIYIQAAEEARARGQQSIILVPEISLTPQIVERFSRRLRTVTVHSRLTLKKKALAWEQLRQGQADVVIGPRSALFVPVPHLGLIVLDEEHDASFKQDSQPRYQTRSVAQKRAQLEGAKLVLGSATPSVEAYTLAKSDPHWHLAVLPERIAGRPLPPMTVIDLRQELQQGNRTVLSKYLRRKLAATLAAGLQAVILQNRRGFSTFILCRDCGYVVECPHCSIAMTWHKTGDLRCHYCGLRKEVGKTCPQCAGQHFRFFGTGTQKVEQELAPMFPAARITRMDKDTMGGQYAPHRIWRDFNAGQGDILLGTQMIAKGFDFPKVNLVGVISADTTLNLPDFRAGERTFQLLTQVAGRAGRSAQTADSEVVVQTYQPEHPAIKFATAYAYDAFYAAEMAQRQELGYPPFSELILITVRSRDYSVAQQFMPGLFPSPYQRLRGEYRFQKLIKKTEIEPRELEKLANLNIPGVTIEVDIDPVSFM